MALITDVHAREILDSRGNPTVEVDLVLEELNKQLPNANLTTLGRMKKS